MGRLFTQFEETVLEVRRDLAKGTRIEFTRVQHHTGRTLPGRERTNYEYTVMSGIPDTPLDLVKFGCEHDFSLYQSKEDQAVMREWLDRETNQRLFPLTYANQAPADHLHPALAKTFEGNWPAYLYRERLVGAVETIVQILKVSPDSRRAYWPIFHPTDALRAQAPTRIPCSIGYQFMLRFHQGHPLLLMTYLQRSSDFDTFWLSDIFLARQFQQEVATRLKVQMGSFSHYIISLHSFKVEGTEIY